MSYQSPDILDDIKSAINRLYDVRIRSDFGQSLKDEETRQALHSFYNAGHIYFSQLKDDLEIADHAKNRDRIHYDIEQMAKAKNNV